MIDKAWDWLKGHLPWVLIAGVWIFNFLLDIGGLGVFWITAAFYATVVIALMAVAYLTLTVNLIANPRFEEKWEKLFILFLAIGWIILRLASFVVILLLR